jgi:hypothetical protein
VRTFTGEQVGGGERESGPQHVLDREVPGAGTVSVFQVFLPALPQGEGAWGGGGGRRGGERPCVGRFVPVKTLLLLAKPGITAEHLGSLAASLRLAPRLIEELSQKADPLNAHLPPESRRTATREGLSLERAVAHAAGAQFACFTITSTKVQMLTQNALSLSLACARASSRRGLVWECGA